MSENDLPPGANRLVVLIPAYEPGLELISVVEELNAQAPGVPVVVVDDGSGPTYEPIFQRAAELGCVVGRHRENRGKGAALKSGVKFVTERFPDHDVVCADCDGQHKVVDILRVADELAISSDSIVLGARRLGGKIPFKSKIGNDLTRLAVRAATGLALADTQTGLRGYPAALLPWLGTIRGSRFDYELAVLITARRARHAIIEVPIETVYLDGNSGTHFRVVRDSVSVYGSLVRSAFLVRPPRR
jgi:glycosyltransferase involved in cell wall biosynthesis